MSTLGQALAEYRDRLFVGRQRELALFEQWLLDPGDPPTILNLHGIAGSGKTELLQAFFRRFSRAGIPTLAIDGCQARQSQADLQAALEPLRNFPPSRDRRVSAALLIDAYEAIEHHDRWFRETVLGTLDTSVRVVIASRRPIDGIWLKTGGWAQLIRSCPVEALTEEAMSDYLSRRDIVDPALQAEIRALCRGHPLALCRSADLVIQHQLQDLASAPQRYLLVHELARLLLEEVDSRALCEALEAAALVRQLDEALLAALLGEPASADFDQLARLSLVQPVAHGIAVKGAVRQILVEELRWRHPERYTQLRARAIAFYASRYRCAPSEDRPWLMVDWLFLSSRAAIQRLVFEEGAPEQLTIEPARPADQPALEQLRRDWNCSLHQQGQSLFDEDVDVQALARLAAIRFRVARTATGTILGYSAVVPLCRSTLSFLQTNPFVATLLRSSAGSDQPSGVPSSPESADTFVIWHLVPGTVAPGPTRAALIRDLLGLLARARRYLILTAEPRCQEFLSILGFQPIPGVSFAARSGGPPLRGLELDLRAINPERWIEAILDSDLPINTSERSLLNLQPALQEALSHWSDDRVLAVSPLARYLERDPGISLRDQAQAVRQLISEALAAASSTATDADQPALRAIEFAYLQRTSSHERLAERLSVSRSTLYRMLHRGCRLIAAQLVQ